MSARNRHQRRPVAPPVGKDSSRDGRVRRAVVAALIVVATVFLAWASIVRVESGERVFRRTSGLRTAARLAPGRHVALPFVQQIVQLPEGTIRVASTAKVSGEGVDLEIPFEVETQIDDEALAAFLGGTAGTIPPSRTITTEATQAVLEWAKGKSAESLVLEEGGAAAGEALSQRLAPHGFQSTLLRLRPAQGSGDTVAAMTSRLLRERSSDTKLKVAIFGLDGADWEIIDPLAAKGQLPNLARLRSRGAWGNMKTMSPALSPLLWTTVATGKPPEEHGIVDFLVKDSATGQRVPITSRARKVKALWNIFTDAGRSSAFVAWWATWPSEPLQGFMVSDRVAYSLFGFVPDEQGASGMTYPEELYLELRPKLVDTASITADEVRRFAAISPAEEAASRQRMSSASTPDYRDPIVHLRKILASARSYQATALEILKRGQPDLFAVYYEGIDEVCHRFAHFMPPRMDFVPAEDYAKYRNTVFEYYKYQDHLLGEILDRLSPETVVIVLSDHGFQNGSGRPQEPANIEGKPGLWHRRYGIFIASGPDIRPGRLDTTSLLDVAPTVLYLTGLPIAQDMTGRVLKEAIAPVFLARFAAGSVPSYENVGRPLNQVRPSGPPTGADEELVEKLRSLGYIAGGSTTEAPGEPVGRGEEEALVTAHLNEAGLYLKKRDYARAKAALQEALRIEPNLVAARLLEVNIEEGLRNFDRAGEVARQILETRPDEEPRLYDELRWIYIHGDHVREGIAYFGDLVRRRPEVAEVHAALGALLLRARQTEAGERELREALRLNPALPEPLTELYPLYRNSPRIVALEPLVRKGLEKNDRSIVHLNWLGLIFQAKRDLPRAEASFKAAMELDPDHAGTLSNLGALYGRSGRLQEAVDILSRAVVKDPDNVESWMNLGAAQGRLGRSREAIRSLETAREKGVRTTALYNALAIAYLQDHQRDKAVQYLKESLSIDPGQKDASELLKAASRPS